MNTADLVTSTLLPFPVFKYKRKPKTLPGFRPAGYKGSRSYRDKVEEIIRATVYIAGLTNHVADLWIKDLPYDPLSIKQYISDISTKAIKYAFRDDRDLSWVDNPVKVHLSFKQAHLVYSMRRAIPPIDPELIGDSFGDQLFTDPVDTYTTEELKGMFKFLPKKIRHINIPTVTSNKATLEVTRKRGGRDFISSRVLKYFEFEDDVNVPPCMFGDPPDKYQDF